MSLRNLVIKFQDILLIDTIIQTMIDMQLYSEIITIVFPNINHQRNLNLMINTLMLL